MSPRLRLALVSSIIAAGLVLLGFGSAVLVLSSSQAGSDAAVSDASKIPPIIADSHNMLTAPVPVRYEATGTATSTYGTDTANNHAVEGTTTGNIELTDNVLTQASIEISAAGYPTISFTLTESCFLGRDAATGDTNAIAYGLVTVDGVERPTDLSLNASFGEDTGTVTGTITVPNDLLSAAQQSAGFSVQSTDVVSGTVDFSLNAERLADTSDAD
ncbi:hypothetical protein GCM10022198_11890 [Klugiella xanthotipulae]|uniref:Uncharacterized protein n=1 Tax=Klugiella xanthotipulae TaxID=244735 RepID=A0A543I521_9MICO|nr:hypothetical protein [Klugiella xanthotipulae]TQM65570.1 hypothetical protein FB466_0375 [Klugiella xanthotipulae]